MRSNARRQASRGSVGTPDDMRIGSDLNVTGVHTEIQAWLLQGTLSDKFIDDIFVQFCSRVRQQGISVARASLYLQTDHPQWFGIRILWRLGAARAESCNFEYSDVDTEQFQSNPAGAVRRGTDEVRRRLDGEADADEHPFFSELRSEHLTDYVAWPLIYTQGKRHMIAFTSDRQGGFERSELEILHSLLPVLAVVTEVRHKNRLMRLLLDTYVGPHAGELILDGATRRGSGTTMRAAIMVVDLRGFTALSELWPRDDVISLLNDYFEVISSPIQSAGGEILKFMGDGLLATFPIDELGASRSAQQAALEVCRAMDSLNRSLSARGLQPLGFGIGLNIGDVMYGNIGSRTRLDFTMIGPAVNIAARLEALTKELGVSVLFSRVFAESSEGRRQLISMGRFPIRGLGEPMEVFRFADVFLEPFLHATGDVCVDRRQR